MLGEKDIEKKNAAEKAVDFVKPGMIIGLGHGSTALYSLLKLSQLLKEGILKDIFCIPCSDLVYETARKFEIPLTTLEEHPVLDMTIDGADEIDPSLNLIKGRGGALLREKIVAQASRREIIVADSSKLSPILGTNHPVPVEVFSFGWRTQASFLESLGAKVEIFTAENGETFLTDQKNMILNCSFGPIDNPEYLAERINGRAGIAGHGLFLGMATDVIIGDGDEIHHLHRKEVFS
jgi:ribose 5-phosphate isomerase A